MNLTPRQYDIVVFIRKHLNEQGIPPGLKDIQNALGITCQVAYRHVCTMVKKGILRKNPNRPYFNLEIVGDELLKRPPPYTIRGFFTQNRKLEFNIDQKEMFLSDLVGLPGKVFVIKVKGNSLNDQYIQDGDLLFFDDRTQAKNGETILVKNEDKTLELMTFHRDGHQYRLKSFNPGMPIYVDTVDMLGVLRSVIRPMTVSTKTIGDFIV